jgi:hypothetical protein
MAGGRHVLESCTRLCFARSASCEARAPFVGSIPGILALFLGLIREERLLSRAKLSWQLFNRCHWGIGVVALTHEGYLRVQTVLSYLHARNAGTNICWLGDYRGSLNQEVITSVCVL